MMSRADWGCFSAGAAEIALRTLAVQGAVPRIPSVNANEKSGKGLPPGSSGISDLARDERRGA